MVKENRLPLLSESYSVGQKTTRILIFMMVQSILLELFTFFVIVLTHEFSFFLSVISECILSILVKANRHSLLFKSCSAGQKLNFYEI